MVVVVVVVVAAVKRGRSRPLAAILYGRCAVSCMCVDRQS